MHLWRRGRYYKVIQTQSRLAVLPREERERSWSRTFTATLASAPARQRERKANANTQEDLLSVIVAHPRARRSRLIFRTLMAIVRDNGTHFEASMRHETSFYAEITTKGSRRASGQCDVYSPSERRSFAVRATSSRLTCAPMLGDATLSFSSGSWFSISVLGYFSIVFLVFFRKFSRCEGSDLSVVDGTKRHRQINYDRRKVWHHWEFAGNMSSSVSISAIGRRLRLCVNRLPVIFSRNGISHFR